MKNLNDPLLYSLLGVISGIVAGALLTILRKRIRFARKTGYEAEPIFELGAQEADSLRERLERAAELRKQFSSDPGPKVHPIEASIRSSMNLLGHLVDDIGTVYPNKQLLVEVHRKTACEFRELAAKLEVSSLEEELEVPLTCGYIGGYSNMLTLISECLLQPIASLRHKNAEEQMVKQAAVAGLRQIADLLDKDAANIECGDSDKSLKHL